MRESPRKLPAPPDPSALLVDLYRTGELRMDAIVQRIALDDINVAFEGLRRGDAIRSVIVY